MIRITRNDDIAFNVNEVRGKGDRYKITFYTVNSAVNIQKTDQDVTDGIITLNGSELMTIGEGVMNFRVDNIAPSAGYNDGVYNSSFTRTTKYYIVSGVIIPDGEDTETVIDLVSELQNSISSEITRSTNKDNAHDAALANVYTKAEIDEMLDDIDVTETDPTVPSWAKQPTKPTYTASEVGALPSSTVIPSKTSDLTNDSGFVTGSKIYVGECTTAAGTMPKVCTVEQFPTDNQGKPLVGTTIAVKFTNTNNGSTNRGLDVNGTGSAQVYQNTAVTTNNSYYGTANRYIQYFWDGQYWVFLSWGYDANTTYTNVTLGHGYAIQNNSAAATAITATLSSYALTTGGIVSVKFNYDVPAGATLNINSKGAKAIYNKDAAITAGVIKAGDTATFIYNTYYRLISIDSWQDNTGGGSGQYTLIKANHDENEDTWSFTDADNTALTHAHVIQILENHNLGNTIMLSIADEGDFIYREVHQYGDDEYKYWDFINSNNNKIRLFEIEWYYNTGATELNCYLSETEIPTTLGYYGSGVAYQTNTSSSSIIASLINYQLTNGIVVVYFRRQVNSGATLNISYKGAKPIYYDGKVIQQGVIPANSFATFAYYENRYNLIEVGVKKSNDCYHATPTVSSGTATYTLDGYGFYEIEGWGASNVTNVEINLVGNEGTEPLHTIMFRANPLDMSNVSNVSIKSGNSGVTWTNESPDGYWGHFGEDTNCILVKVYCCDYASFQSWR